MSVLIKGMEMPKNCAECNVNDAAKCGTNYKYLLEHEAYYDSVRPDCPLIEQKTGKWIDKWYCSNMSGYEYAMKCSECSKPTYRISFAEPMPNYCPNCGARMDGE